MPTKLVVASDNFVREFQTYEDCHVWLNFNNRNKFVEEIFVKEEFDIFGILSKGMSFKDENSADIIVKIFEAEKNLACIITEERCNGVNSMFINTNLTGVSINTQDIIKSDKWQTLYIEGLVKVDGEAQN